MTASNLPAEVQRRMGDNALLDELIKRARERIKSTKIFEKLEVHQLKNLQAMAEATDSFAALENFLLYQMGRKREEWLHKNFGPGVLEDLKWLGERAKQISAGDSELECRIHMELVRHYLGYLARWFVAYEKLEELARREGHA